MVDYIYELLDTRVDDAEVDALEGQGMVEYGLILVLVSVVAIAVLALVGEQVADVFDQVLGYLGGGDGGDGGT